MPKADSSRARKRARSKSQSVLASQPCSNAPALAASELAWVDDPNLAEDAERERLRLEKAFLDLRCAMARQQRLEEHVCASREGRTRHVRAARSLRAANLLQRESSHREDEGDDFSRSNDLISVSDIKRWAVESSKLCVEMRKRLQSDVLAESECKDVLSGGSKDRSDAQIRVALAKACRFTDALPLADYRDNLTRFPRIVNVVTLSTVKPVDGSGTTLPLPLASIARKCTGAYFAPRRFAAVQLALSNPRCRVLVFHTGRIVGTGTTSHTAAKLAVVVACLRLSREAGIHLEICNFDVINSVGAASLHASFSCEEFAKAHTSTSMLDRASFVGLVWRPKRSPIKAEIYSTGRLNLPGAKTSWALHHYFARLLPEITKFSSAAQTERAVAEREPLEFVEEVDDDNLEKSGEDGEDGEDGEEREERNERSLVHAMDEEEEEDSVWDELGFV